MKRHDSSVSLDGRPPIRLFKGGLVLSLPLTHIITFSILKGRGEGRETTLPISSKLEEFIWIKVCFLTTNVKYMKFKDLWV